MILADENIDHSLIETIRKLGIEVYSIFEILTANKIRVRLL